MTTIGTAVLQIIPSLLGVTEAIEKQIDGKVVEVTIEPKVDKRAAEAAGKETGEQVTKATKDAVRKGDIGKTVNEEVTKSVKKSSPGKDAAKVIVDGIADGVRGELDRGSVGGSIGNVIVTGIAEGVKQGIDGEGLGGQVVDTIGDGIKSGNIGKKIRDAVIPTITNIGTEISLGAGSWARGIGDALRSGDIQGATDDIGNTVRTTTDTIATIGSTFGLQLEGVRVFGEQAGTTLSNVGGEVQGMVDTALNLKGTFEQVGDVMGTVLPGKAATGAQAITTAFAGPLAGLAALNLGVSKLPKDAQAIAAAIPGVAPGFRDKGADAPWYERDITMDVWRWLKEKGGHATGGYTGNFPIDKIAGVVHGGEYVIQKSATDRLQASAPGLLEALNGYAGGGLVDDAKKFAQSMDPAKYLMGGFSPSAIDCSGFVAAVANVATGRPPFSSRMSTVTEGSWLQSLGFKSGRGGAGDLRVGWWDKGGGANGHTAGTFPDGTNFESNGSQGVVVGGKTGAGSGQFTNHAYLPVAAAQNVGGAGEGRGAGQAPASETTQPAAATAGSSAPSGGFSLAESFSGLSATGLAGLGKGVGKTESGSDLSLFGGAAADAVSGQVSSALGVLGVGDSPGWLKGISTFVGGLSVSDKATGKTVFSGKNLGGTFGGAAPAVATSSSAAPTGPAHGTAGGAAPGPAVTYNIKTATVEDAFTQARRREEELAAAQLSRYGAH